MLLGNWADLDPDNAQRIEDELGWIVQPKMYGVRALMHIEASGIRFTSRCVSEVTYRLGEFQDNVHHLTIGLSGLEGTVLDGELVFPSASLDTGKNLAQHPLQAAMAIVSTSPEQAARLQDRPETRLRFHAFNILRFRDEDSTKKRLSDDPSRWAQGASSRRRFLPFSGRGSFRASVQLEMFAPGIRPADTLPSWCRAHI
jgi:ATP-dependent DNA ligase